MCKPRIYSLNIKLRSEGFERFKDEANNMMTFADKIPKIKPPMVIVIIRLIHHKG
jgi:hypothetical protein